MVFAASQESELRRKTIVGSASVRRCASTPKRKLTKGNGAVVIRRKGNGPDLFQKTPNIAKGS